MQPHHSHKKIIKLKKIWFPSRTVFPTFWRAHRDPQRQRSPWSSPGRPRMSPPSLPGSPSYVQPPGPLLTSGWFRCQVFLYLHTFMFWFCQKQCTVPQNINPPSYLYILFLHVIRFFTNKKYALLCDFTSVFIFTYIFIHVWYWQKTILFSIVFFFHYSKHLCFRFGKSLITLSINFQSDGFVVIISVFIFLHTFKFWYWEKNTLF